MWFFYHTFNYNIVILSGAKDLLSPRRQQILRYAQDDKVIKIGNSKAEW
jgi:hypothetical protein